MMHTRVRYFMTAGLAAAAATATAAVMIASPASARPTTPAGSKPVVIVNCNGQGLVKPSTYDIFCMASQQFISGVSWTSWRTTAFGAGTYEQNNCTPTCAQGKYVKYPILLVLWRAQPWPSHQGRKYFSRLTLIFTGKLLPGLHVDAKTFSLSATGAP